MNRRQQERVEDLGIAFQEAIVDLISLGGEGNDEEMKCSEEYPVRNTPIPNPVEEIRIADYEVSIRQVNNGFLVNVGCQTFVFEKFETASKYMAMYFENPSETTRKHYEGTLFK
jgi:hypothetical protein